MSLWLKLVADKADPEEDTQYTSYNKTGKNDESFGGVITPSEPTVGEKPQSGYGPVNVDNVLDTLGENKLDRNDRQPTVSPVWTDYAEKPAVELDTPSTPGNPFGYN